MATRTDALLLVMVLIWGANYSIVKLAFAEIDPQAFNAVRMLLATVLFLAVMIAARVREPGESGVFYTPARFTRRDWWTLAWLGVIVLARAFQDRPVRLLDAVAGLVASLTRGLLNALGVAAERMGTVLYLPGGFSYDITIGCTGLLPAAVLAATAAAVAIHARAARHPALRADTWRARVGRWRANSALGTKRVAPGSSLEERSASIA